MNLSTNHPPSDIDLGSSDSEAAMAAAMGFSGFGKAPAAKKRKYNAKTDAFIDGQELQNVDRGGKKGQGSGGNEVPLGRMRVLGAQTQAPSAQEQDGEKGRNEEEVDLDLDMEDEGEEDRPMEERCLDTSRPPPAEEWERNKARRAERRGMPMVNEDEIMLDDEDNDETSTTLPAPPATETTAAQEALHEIDAVPAAPADAQPPVPIPQVANAPAGKQKPKQKPKPPQGLAAFMTALQTPVLPPPSIPPPPGTTSTPTIIPPAPGTSGTVHTYSIAQSSRQPSSAPSTAGSTHRGGRTGGRGQRNELWYVDYYDPSFNENPWKQLEKELGLPSVGTWLERQPRIQHQGSV